MPAKFSFYEVVKVVSVGTSLKGVSGKLGSVLGIAENDGGSWVYTVHIFDLGESWFAEEKELVSMGTHMKRDDFFSGDSITVPAPAPNIGTRKI